MAIIFATDEQYYFGGDVDFTADEIVEAFKKHPEATILPEELPNEAFWEAIQKLEKMGEKDLAEQLLRLYGKTTVDLYFDFSLPAEGHSFQCDPDLPRYGYCSKAMRAYAKLVENTNRWDYHSAMTLARRRKK